LQETLKEFAIECVILLISASLKRLGTTKTQPISPLLLPNDLRAPTALNEEFVAVTVPVPRETPSVLILVFAEESRVEQCTTKLLPILKVIVVPLSLLALQSNDDGALPRNSTPVGKVAPFPPKTAMRVADAL
jgi:hypothetical protein